jgi:hypothetical protein
MALHRQMDDLFTGEAWSEPSGGKHIGRVPGAGSIDAAARSQGNQ